MASEIIAKLKKQIHIMWAVIVVLVAVIAGTLIYYN